MALVNAITYLQSQFKLIEGIRTAPDRPKESFSAFPFIVSFPVSGRFTRAGHFLSSTHTIAVELHVARKDLQRDISKALSLHQPIIEAIHAKKRLDNNVDTLGTASYDFGFLRWGKLQNVGYTYRFEVTKRYHLSNPDFTPEGANKPTFLGLLTAIQERLPDSLRNKKDTPPEVLNAFPTSVVYPQSGEIHPEAGFSKGVHTIAIEVHQERVDLYRDTGKIFPYIESVPQAVFKDSSLGGAATSVNEMEYRTGSMDWGDIETIGVTFGARIKALYA